MVYYFFPSLTSQSRGVKCFTLTLPVHYYRYNNKYTFGCYNNMNDSILNVSEYILVCLAELLQGKTNSCTFVTDHEVFHVLLLD